MAPHIDGKFRLLDAKLGRKLERVLRRFFAAQAARVVQRYLTDHGTKQDPNDEPETIPPAAEELLPLAEATALWLAIAPFLIQAMLQSASLAGVTVGLSGLIQADMDPRVAEILKDAGTRITGIQQTTLDAIRQTLIEGVAAGYTPNQIAYGVPADNFAGLQAVVTETYAGRAGVIARTEIARARNLIAVERYREAGHYMLYVYDGPGCGWVTHNDPDSAAGSIRPAAECYATPQAHPSCQRAFSPA